MGISNLALHNNVVDVFFDGKLKMSKILKGAPKPNTDPMYVCYGGGFNGYISNMKYSNRAIGADKIHAMYKDGPTL